MPSFCLFCARPEQGQSRARAGPEMRRPTTCPPLDHDAVVSVLPRRTARPGSCRTGQQYLLIGPSHDNKALRGCSPFMLLLQSSHLFDCDEQGAGLFGLVPSCLVVACQHSSHSQDRINSCRKRAVEDTDGSDQHNLTPRTAVHGSASWTREDLFGLC